MSPDKERGGKKPNLEPQKQLSRTTPQQMMDGIGEKQKYKAKWALNYISRIGREILASMERIFV